MCTCVYYIYICTYACSYVSVSIFGNKIVQIYIHPCIHTYIHAYIHAYMHTRVAMHELLLNCCHLHGHISCWSIQLLHLQLHGLGFRVDSCTVSLSASCYQDCAHCFNKGFLPSCQNSGFWAGAGMVINGGGSSRCNRIFAAIVYRLELQTNLVS